MLKRKAEEKRNKLMEHGIHGIVSVGICYILFALRIVLPILLILNILELTQKAADGDRGGGCVGR